MPRSARLDAPGVLHHIMIRGIERRKIFLNNKNRGDFLERLSKQLPETKTAYYAWVFVPNHAHFLFQTDLVPLTTVMRRLLIRIRSRFKRRHNHHGQLFQNRYKSIVCQEDVYLKELVCYSLGGELEMKRGGGTEAPRLSLFSLLIAMQAWGKWAPL